KPALSRRPGASAASILVRELLAPTAKIRVKDGRCRVVVKRLEVNLNHDFTPAFFPHKGQMGLFRVIRIVSESLDFIETRGQRQQIHVHEVKSRIAVVPST